MNTKGNLTLGNMGQNTQRSFGKPHSSLKTVANHASFFWIQKSTHWQGETSRSRAHTMEQATQTWQTTRSLTEARHQAASSLLKKTRSPLVSSLHSRHPLLIILALLGGIKPATIMGLAGQSVVGCGSQNGQTMRAQQPFSFKASID